MSRWVREGHSQSDDIRLSYVVRHARDPLLHEALGQLRVRGGYAALLRHLLRRALQDGSLQDVVAALNSGRLIEPGSQQPGAPAQSGSDVPRVASHPVAR
ncbi:MAG: hypothetical protein N2690_06695 [Rhodocyclaceae bacterium]|nr:hypothetical protein [Rhodocyclaceae bacterium]